MVPALWPRRTLWSVAWRAEQELLARLVSAEHRLYLWLLMICSESCHQDIYGEPCSSNHTSEIGIKQ
jgi:hypothetical protein